MKESRSEFVIRAMNYFNSKRQHYNHVIDAEELGVLHFYWLKGSWHHEWIELERIPGDFKN